MTNHRYPTLLIAALAATFIGAAVAQTQSDDSSRMPAQKGMAQESQTQPSTDQTDKMKQDQAQGQSQSEHNKMQKSHMAAKSGAEAKPEDQHAMKSDHSAKTEKSAMTEKSAAEHPAHSAQASDKSMKQGMKSKRTGEEAASPDEKAYREALRDCAKQQDQTQRDSCLDGAIEKFHRNA